MTKAEYIDFIRNSLPQVDKTSRYQHQQVAAAINVAVNTIFYDMYKQQPKSFKKSMERYTVWAINTPAINAYSGRYTSTITVDVVDLPRKSSGILEILQGTLLGLGPSDTTTTKFIPVSTMEGEQFYGSESSLPDNVIGFSFSGARAIEYWGMKAADATLGVYIRLIKQFKAYALTDNVILPYGRDQQIIELVRQFLGAIPPKDLLNDNADGRN